MELDIGRRLRFFRKRVGISQLDLETEIDGSPGMISRIEGNFVNPTKETILKIADVLNLNGAELDYIIGKSVRPASLKEIENAKREASQELETKEVLAYLLDERWRFHQFSNTFIQFLYLSKADIDYLLEMTAIQALVRKDSPLLERLDKDFFEGLLSSYLAFYHATMSFMADDEVYQQSVEDIVRNNLARKIWVGLVYERDREFVLPEERIIYFDLQGRKIALNYFAFHLPLNSRFLVVEYHSKNKIPKFSRKII